MIGLNIAREVINQVAREGFASLPEEVRTGLPLATCNVSDAYRVFLRGVLSKHPMDEAAYEHFCEAQILWDASMAENLAAYLQKRQQGISKHLDRYGHFRQRVLLPEVPGWLEYEKINEQVSDYLLMGVGQGPLH